MKLGKHTIAISGSLGLLIWAATGLIAAQDTPSQRLEDGIALAFIYDNSGSMRETVPDGQGGQSRKEVIAKRALGGIIDRLQAFSAGSAGSEPRNLQTALVIFGDGHAAMALPLSKFNPAQLKRRLDRVESGGSTPLGEALRLGSLTVLRSNLSRKHVLVITDGINTTGPDPVAVLPPLQKQAERQGSAFSVHFVAFDVEAKVFDPVKKLGVSVLGAADEKQLNTQLEFILEKKILLEREEPANAEKK